MTVVKASSDCGTPPTLSVAMLPPSSGPPMRHTVEHYSDDDDNESVDSIESTDPTTISHESANLEDLVHVQNDETHLIKESSETIERSMNRESAKVAPLKLAQSSCSAASSEQTSPENVIFNLPEDLDDNAKNMLDVRASSKPAGTTRDLQGAITNTMEGDEVANIISVPNQATTSTSNGLFTSIKMKDGKDADASDHDDVESLPDPQLFVKSKVVDGKVAPGPRFKSKLPLAVRLHKDPPYPPPSFPLPATPPEEPRRPRTRERTQPSGAKAYRPFPPEHRITRLPIIKASPQSNEESTAKKQPSDEISLPKANVESSQVSFPTFGNSSWGSSSQYSSSLEYKDPNQPIQTSGVGPKVPTVVISNITATESEADLIQQPEMPTDTGSPIFYGRRRGRNAPPPKSNTAQDHPDILQQVNSSATSSYGTSGDGQTTSFTLPPIPRLTPFTASKPPREVVDATAELRKLASDPLPSDHEHPKAQRQTGQQIPRSHHPMGNLARPHVGSYEDTVICHSQVPAPSRGTDRIHPSSVVAASTPSRLLTHEFIRSLIHTELTDFQNDLRTKSVSRPGALADDAEIQAQNAAAEGRIFVAVVDAIAREDRLDQFGGSLGEDPFYDTGSNEGLNYMHGPQTHGVGRGLNHGHMTGFPYTGVFSPTEGYNHSASTHHPFPIMQQPPGFPSYLVPPPTPATNAPPPTHPQPQQSPPRPQPAQPTAPPRAARSLKPPHQPEAPLWGPSSETIVRPAPGPFLYAGADPEELKRKDEEKRQKRRERERDRAQKKEEKNKQKANEEALKELRKSQSRDSASLHGSAGGTWGSGGSEGGGSVGGGGSASVSGSVSASLKPKSSFGGSLRRAFNVLKKPVVSAPGPALVEEEGEEVGEGVRESVERGRTRERGRGHGHPGHGQQHPGSAPGSSHGHA
ncbi:uncharacterized protein GGS22DRAFT_199030 [Annulohypoxylon maeteangense]|uniref:uncharacterized protein n=1 Tax=Annulohypoxylon maeteangense TaxID=1927788 RepID=UPI00200810EA|nr:uncharacterized protein GGS22DRAFT_199030 [Annulohypoxylon maeteangense]KAI0886629.1 hypothetical protein GGS22DRAFT_199030 [Annulohypoxylon maeteangense]